MTEDRHLTTVVVHAWQCDHLGHLNSRHYAAAFDDAIFVLWARLGLALEPGSSNELVPVSAEMRTTFKSEALVGSILHLSGKVVHVGGKSVRLRFEMTDARTGALRASCEAVDVMFDKVARESRPIPDVLRERLVADLNGAAARLAP